MRASLYHYKFSDIAERWTTGAVWTRSLLAGPHTIHLPKVTAVSERPPHQDWALFLSVFGGVVALPYDCRMMMLYMSAIVFWTTAVTALATVRTWQVVVSAL